MSYFSVEQYGSVFVMCILSALDSCICRDCGIETGWLIVIVAAD